MKTLKMIWVFVFLLLASMLFAQNQRAVLVRGNNWQTGIPGFGSNTFSALFGEYLTETTNAITNAAGREYQPRQFIVRVSGQAFLFNPNMWQPRPGLNSALQRQDSGSFLIALPYASPNNMGTWTIFFQFPQGLASGANSSLFNDAEANTLIRAWMGRFSYFLSLVKNFSDLSLPAVVIF